jgi:hypothetical protein
MAVTHWSDAPPDRVLTMPCGPSTNALWVRAAGKPRKRSPEYTAWLHVAGWEVRRQMVATLQRGLLGAEHGDTLDDLFPGTGAIGAAWAQRVGAPPQMDFAPLFSGAAQ